MNDKKEISLDITDFLKILLKRWWIIFIVLLFSFAMTFAYVKLTHTDKYSSTATVYVLNKSDSDQSLGEMSQGLDVASGMVNDCEYFIKSESVVTEVIERLSLDKDADDLSSMIKSKNPDKTRVIEVSVISENAEQSKKIVDTLCEVSVEKINQLLGREQIRMYEYGRIDTTPCNPIGWGIFVTVPIIAAFITYAALVAAYVIKKR